MVATSARLTLATRPALRPLLAPLAPFEDVLGTPPQTPEAKINLAALAGRFDAFLPIMSLPWLLGVTRPDTEVVPWPRPDPEAVAAWRRRHEAALPGATTIAGLVWRASPESASAAVRSLPAEALAPLGELPGLGLVVLQGGVTEERRQL